MVLIENPGSILLVEEEIIDSTGVDSIHVTNRITCKLDAGSSHRTFKLASSLFINS